MRLAVQHNLALKMVRLIHLAKVTFILSFQTPVFHQQGTFFLILLFICFYCFGRPSLERFLANTVSFEESVEENEKLRPPVITVAKCQIFYTELIKKPYDCYPR